MMSFRYIPSESIASLSHRSYAVVGGVARCQCAGCYHCVSTLFYLSAIGLREMISVETI